MTWTNKVQNIGNVSVQGLDMIDILPFPGNIGVGNPTNLGSTWQPQFLGALTLSGAPPGTTVYYSTEGNPCRPAIAASPGCVPMTTVTGVPPGV
jgi:large repetitive protein